MTLLLRGCAADWSERDGDSTHAFNYTQRFLTLSIQSRDTTSLTVAAPANANLAPPNFYMVFVINASGVPSVARIVRVGP